MDYYAGVDLGATRIRVAVAEREAFVEEGDLLASRRGPTPEDVDGERIVDALLDLFEEACRAAGVDPGDLSGVGVGSIGPLDLDRGAVVNPVNLPGVDAIPLRESIAGITDVGPIHLRNDAVAGLIGERFFAAAPPDDMVYLTVSSGIGAGVSVDGRVLAGRNGNIAEVGHFVVDPDGRMTCGCGRDGHWEAYAGGKNVPGFVRALQDADPVETDLPLDEPGFSAADVFDRPDDPLAARAIDRIGRYNAIGLADIVHAYAPTLVAVGGAVALRNPTLVIDPLPERVGDLLAVDAPEIRPAALGEDAVLVGAIAAALGA